jgi:hypothetical protein
VLTFIISKVPVHPGCVITSQEQLEALIEIQDLECRMRLEVANGAPRFVIHNGVKRPRVSIQRDLGSLGGTRDCHEFSATNRTVVRNAQC